MNHTATEDQTIEELKAIVDEKQAQYKEAILKDLVLTNEALHMAWSLCAKLTETRELLQNIEAKFSA